MKITSSIMLRYWRICFVYGAAALVVMGFYLFHFEFKENRRSIHQQQNNKEYLPIKILMTDNVGSPLVSQKAKIKRQMTSILTKTLFETYGTNSNNSKDYASLNTSNFPSSSKQTKNAEAAANIPGFISMDRDLSLPPEVPIRPNSSEPILVYGQRRDYKAIIKHDNDCGKKSPIDFNLTDFNYDRDIFLLMVIKSSCSMKSRRNAIRQTWGNEQWIKEHLNINIKRFFLLGACTNDDLRNGLVEEVKTYKDVLQWDFFDSFRNLTLKDCLFMQWFSKNCRSVPYVFKGDDDVFVNVKNIVKYLKELPIAKRKDLFLGSVLDGSPRILDPSWKYYVSYNLFPDKFYPAYVSGGGFILSGDMVFRLFQASLFIRIIPIDDAFLGILLKRIGVSPENDRGFKSWGLKKYSVCRLSKIKTFHRMSPDKMLQAWKEFSNLNTSSCDKESDDVFA